MRQDALSIDRSLTAAAGENAGLRAELEAIFLESAARHALALVTAGTAIEWRDAAWRLKGCAASFGAGELMAAAEMAEAATVGDVATLLRAADAVGWLAAAQAE